MKKLKNNKENLKNSFSLIFLILTLLFFHSIFKNNILDWSKSDYPAIFAEALNPIINQSQDKENNSNNSMVQVNYFSELTRAFLHGKPYLMVKPDKNLIDPFESNLVKESANLVIFLSIILRMFCGNLKILFEAISPEIILFSFSM